MDGYTEHPFYSLINEIGADKFRLELLETTTDEKESQELEIKYIAEVPDQLKLNKSRGGYYDEIDGSRFFWDNLTPEDREVYLKKLSDIKKESDWTDYKKLHEQLDQWRKTHLRYAYENGRRAIRIANRTNPTKQKQRPHEPETQEQRKRRLMWRYNQSKARSINTTKNWEGYSEEKRESIAKKISESRKQWAANLSQEERNQMVATARSHIDRKKQGAAASKGVKKFWEELRKDPVRYQAYIEQRRKTFSQTMRAKHANV